MSNRGLTDVLAQNDALRRQIRSLENEVSSLKASRKQQYDRAETLQNDLILCRQKDVQKSAELEKYKHDLSLLRSQRTELDDALKSQEQYVRKLESKIVNGKQGQMVLEQNAKLRNSLEQSKAEVELLKSSLDKHRDDVEKANREIEILAVALELRADELNLGEGDVRSGLLYEISYRRDQEKKLQLELQHRDDIEEGLRSEIKKLKDDIISANNDNILLRDRVATLIQEVEDHVGKGKSCDKRLSEVTHERDVALDYVSKSGSEIAELRIEIDKLTSKCSSLEQAKQGVEQRLSQLQNVADISTQSLSQERANTRDYQHKVEILETEKKVLLREKSSLQNQLDIANQTASALERDALQATENVKTLEIKLAELTRERNLLLEESTQLKADVHRKSTMISTLEADLASARERVDLAERRARELSTVGQLKNLENSQLQQLLATARSEVGSLRDSRAAMQGSLLKQLSTLKGRMAEVEGHGEESRISLLLREKELVDLSKELSAQQKQSDSTRSQVQVGISHLEDATKSAPSRLDTDHLLKNHLLSKNVSSDVVISNLNIIERGVPDVVNNNYEKGSNNTQDGNGKVNVTGIKYPVSPGREALEQAKMRAKSRLLAAQSKNGKFAYNQMDETNSKVGSLRKEGSNSNLAFRKNSRGNVYAATASSSRKQVDKGALNAGVVSSSLTQSPLRANGTALPVLMTQYSGPSSNKGSVVSSSTAVITESSKVTFSNEPSGVSDTTDIDAGIAQLMLSIAKADKDSLAIISDLFPQVLSDKHVLSGDEPVKLPKNQQVVSIATPKVLDTSETIQQTHQPSDSVRHQQSFNNVMSDLDAILASEDAEIAPLKENAEKDTVIGDGAAVTSKVDDNTSTTNGEAPIPLNADFEFEEQSENNKHAKKTRTPNRRFSSSTVGTTVSHSTSVMSRSSSRSVKKRALANDLITSIRAELLASSAVAKSDLSETGVDGTSVSTQNVLKDRDNVSKSKTIPASPLHSQEITTNFSSFSSSLGYNDIVDISSPPPAPSNSSEELHSVASPIQSVSVSQSLNSSLDEIIINKNEVSESISSSISPDNYLNASLNTSFTDSSESKRRPSSSSKFSSKIASFVSKITSPPASSMDDGSRTSSLPRKSDDIRKMYEDDI